MNLEQKNKDLMEKQDYEINIATLNERNRIAREIHDNVGHLLSSSILQIGALMSICKDQVIANNLNTLKQTLSEGMDSIRSSIHNIHDEYVDLNKDINEIINKFTFCDISFNYDIKNSPDKKYKICFISIIKEALSNVIKHSNASKVEITLREHPALYQLIIKDNGTTKKENSDGIGIKNMIYRINSLNGVININTDNGYCIFISLPK
jgi:signal transduction histidine kinase